MLLVVAVDIIAQEFSALQILKSGHAHGIIGRNQLAVQGQEVVVVFLRVDGALAVVGQLGVDGHAVALDLDGLDLASRKALAQCHIGGKGDAVVLDIPDGRERAARLVHHEIEGRIGLEQIAVAQAGIFLTQAGGLIGFRMLIFGADACAVAGDAAGIALFGFGKFHLTVERDAVDKAVPVETGSCVDFTSGLDDLNLQSVGANRPKFSHCTTPFLFSFRRCAEIFYVIF